LYTRRKTRGGGKVLVPSREKGSRSTKGTKYILLLSGRGVRESYPRKRYKKRRMWGAARGPGFIIFGMESFPPAPERTLPGRRDAPPRANKERRTSRYMPTSS